jgi:hypothetical protein
MINANEFKLGNLVYTFRTNLNFNEWVETPIKHFHFQTCLDKPDWFNPIPLTEKYLKRAGFKPFVKDWQLNGIIIHTRKRGYVIRKSIPIIKYVHQLQNLYFCLTGQELVFEFK